MESRRLQQIQLQMQLYDIDNFMCRIPSIKMYELYAIKVLSVKLQAG